MRILLTALLTSAFIFYTVGEANSVMFNGGFETGNLAGWQTIGDVSVQTGSIGSGPTEGNFQAVITNDSIAYDFGIVSNPDKMHVYPFSGTPAQWAMNDAFFNLPAGTIESMTFDPNEPYAGHAYLSAGSGLTQSFNVKRGDALTFDWNYLTSDGLNWDFAFVSLASSSLVFAQKLAGNIPIELFHLEPVYTSNTFLQKETGFKTFSFVFPETREYTLGIGVFQVGGAAAYDSGLIIDNFRVTPVPEPATILLFGTGLAGLALVRKK